MNPLAKKSFLRLKSVVGDMLRKGISIVLSLTLLSSVIYPIRVTASVATLSVKPHTTKIWGIDETLGIEIIIEDVTNLYGWEAKLYYNPTILNGTNIIEGPFLRMSGDTFNIMSFNDDYNSTHGRVVVAFTLIGNVSGVSGTGELVTITFKTKAVGISILDLDETRLGDPDGDLIPHNVADGAVQVVKAVHDVSIEDVKVSTAEAVEGNIINIIVTVANEGNGTETFNVTTYRNETIITTQEVSNLTGGAQTTLTFLWDTTGVTVNTTYEIRAEATKVPGETDLVDNVFTDGFVRIVEGTHDIAVKSLTPSSTEVYEGQLAYIYVVIANKGNYSETINVTAYYDESEIGTKAVKDLLYGSEQTLIFIWDTTGVTTNVSYVIKAVANSVPGETNLADNNLTDGSITVYPRELLSIEIIEVIPCDASGQPVTGFTAGAVAYFKVSVHSNSVNPEALLVTVNLYDADSVTIGVVSFQGPIGPSTSTFMLGLPIPKTAHAGEATIRANVLTDWPHLGGTPYSPEKSATFEIVGS